MKYERIIELQFFSPIAVHLGREEKEKRKKIPSDGDKGNVQSHVA